MRTYIVAAFAEAPFGGNPAGVCLLDEALPAGALQQIARELAQPETAFVLGAGGDYAIQWFSPTVEVALCGHATLAAAQVLWGEGFADPAQTIRFTRGDTVLTASPGDEGLIWLDFPGFPGVAAEAPAGAFGCRPPHRAARHADRWLFEYPTARDVRAASPDFAALIAAGVRSLILTAPSDLPDYDIVSRNFAPLVGVDEDQVTGVAHTCLAPHWRDRLGDALRCWQASPRGGGLIARSHEDRVLLGGRAIIEFGGWWRPAQRTPRAPSGGFQHAPGSTRNEA